MIKSSVWSQDSKIKINYLKNEQMELTDFLRTGTNWCKLKVDWIDG